jgi:hypothetical protein
LPLPRAARHLEAAAQEFLVFKRRQGLGARLSEPGAASFRMNAKAARSPSRADERHGTCEMTTVAHYLPDFGQADYYRVRSTP